MFVTNDPSGARLFTRYPIADIERGNRLLTDYQQGSGIIHEFFPAGTLPLSSAPPAQGDRARLAAALANWQQHLGADTAAIHAAQRLADPSTLVITVGQQSGLLTGPLYTLCKALTAINLARRLTVTTGRAVVPVFWLATDDDDRGEADHAGCWDQRCALQPLQYPTSAGAAGDLIGDLPAGRDGEAVLEELAPLLDGLPFAQEVQALLQATLAESADMGEWCARLLARLLSRFGLVLCDPRLPEVRRLSAVIIRRELTQPLATTARVNDCARALQQRGYRPQLTKPPDTCNCFLLDGRRRRISYRDGRFLIDEQAFTAEALSALLEQAPERFAPNAVLRPMVQEYLFGSSAFVVGPNELGYWAELASVFATLAVPMPPVVVRAGTTLLPSNQARVLRQLALDPLDLYFNFERIRLNLLGNALPESVMQSFTASRTDIARLVAHLAASMVEVDPTLAQSVPATLQRMLNEVERLERKTVKALERKSVEHAQRLETLRDTLFPHRGVQERTLNIFSVLARTGFDLMPQLLALLNEQEGQHLFVEL